VNQIVFVLQTQREGSRASANMRDIVQYHVHCSARRHLPRLNVPFATKIFYNYPPSNRRQTYLSNVHKSFAGGAHRRFIAGAIVPSSEGRVRRLAKFLPA
jgi:hypothetical protein